MPDTQQHDPHNSKHPPQPEKMNEKLKTLIIVVVILNILFFGFWFLIHMKPEPVPETKQVEVEENVNENLEKCMEAQKRAGGSADYRRCLTPERAKEIEEMMKPPSDENSPHNKKFNELMRGRE